MDCGAIGIITIVLFIGFLYRRQIIDLILFIGILYRHRKSSKLSSSLFDDQLQQRAHVKPIFLTNNMKKAKEVNLLLGFTMYIDNIKDTKMNALALVTKTAS